MNFKPSPYQQAVIDEVVKGSTNILVGAKAGSGKTATLKMIVGNIPRGKKILMIAFSKHIVNELKQKLPSGIDISTSHSLGMKVINTQGRAKVNSYKFNDVLKEYSKRWERGGSDYIAEYDERRERQEVIRKLTSVARVNLVTNIEELNQLALKHGVNLWSTVAEDILNIIKILDRDKNQIDFNDMIRFPAISNHYQFPKYDFVLIDECQDLNKAQQILMQKVLANGRFVAVGDPHQAIYGFAGADAESFESLAKIPNTKQMPLNVCYRCSKNIIKETQKIVPDIEWFDGNGDGVVNFNAKVADIQVGDMVLCRTTMPLVKLCYRFIGNDIPAYIKGRDIGQNMINFIKKSKKNSLRQLSSWMDEQVDKERVKLSKRYQSLSPTEIDEITSLVNLREKVAIINLIIDNNGTVISIGTLIQKIESIFNDQGNGICLSTVHKSKGLEADRVFIIEPSKMPHPMAKLPWQRVQEMNIKYVAYTRAKEFLGVIPESEFTAYKKK